GQLADDRVHRDLRRLAERVGAVELELHVRVRAVRQHLVGQLAQRRREAVVAQHDRLQCERQVAQLPDRLSLPFERGADDLARLVEPALLDREECAVDHQRDSGELLHRPVVQEQGEAPALVLLGGDQPLEPFAFTPSMIASRSAIATAWVRVSASSLVRMCRTWLLTVSCEMKSLSATSAFESPSASSLRISRSRAVSRSPWSRPARNCGISAGSTYPSPAAIFSI